MSVFPHIFVHPFWVTEKAVYAHKNLSVLYFSYVFCLGGFVLFLLLFGWVNFKPSQYSVEKYS